MGLAANKRYAQRHGLPQSALAAGIKRHHNITAAQVQTSQSSLDIRHKLVIFSKNL
jgi:hypothetical protein